MCLMIKNDGSIYLVQVVDFRCYSQWHLEIWFVMEIFLLFLYLNFLMDSINTLEWISCTLKNLNKERKYLSMLKMYSKSIQTNTFTTLTKPKTMNNIFNETIKVCLLHCAKSKQFDFCHFVLFSSFSSKY